MTPQPEPEQLPENTTVKLTEDLRRRIPKAMRATGSTSYTEFARQALLDRCRKVEGELRQTSPEEYSAIYGPG